MTIYLLFMILYVLYLIYRELPARKYTESIMERIAMALEAIAENKK